MLKKFIDGIIFGLGFAVAFVIIGSLGLAYVVPRMLESTVTKTKEPKFANPTEARVIQATPNVAEPDKKEEFSFFKNSGERMNIPAGGGILAMAPVDTPAGSTRPCTYQLWLTESSLWQIRTIEGRAEIEKLTRPENATVKDLDRLMHEKLGMMARQSTMTVQGEEIKGLKSGTSWRDQSLNGKLSLTVEGVVFVLPNPYK